MTSVIQQTYCVLLLYYIKIIYVMLKSHILLDLVTKIIVHFYIDLTSIFLKQIDYFHIHMDFVILYGSTE